MYVVRNPATGRLYRFSPAVYYFLGLLDGRRTVAEAWSMLATRLDEDAPTQDDVVELLAQLHQADLLQTDMTPDFADLLQRRVRSARSALWRRIGNPMALRVPLWDPDRFLTRTITLFKPLFGLFGVLLWCAVVGPAFGLLFLHFAEFSRGITDRLLATENLVLLAFVFPVVKALHEMGHAYATKAGGGDVHEMGVMFLVLFPIPYVDASASSGFRSRWARMGVGAAGMLVETFIAAVAVYIWVLVEPGITRSLAFTVILIAGISTVVFNGNPLLRYDGYYILSDLLDIPNLGLRCTRYWSWLAERFAFGRRAPAPDMAPGEAKWFIFYGPASFACRMLVSTAIILLVAGKFFVIGVLIALWSAIVLLVRPVVATAIHVVRSPGLAENRRRAIAVSMGTLAALVILLLLVPAPLHTVSEGVIWLPEESIVRAGADGFLARIVATPGQPVAKGALLFESNDPQLSAQIAVDKARVASSEVKVAEYEPTDHVEAGIARRELAIEQSALAHDESMARDLRTKAATDGIFIVPAAEDSIGRFYKRGDVIGYVLPRDVRVARVIVEQDNINLVRTRLKGAEVMSAAAIGRSFSAKVIREVPAASDQLPSPALALQAGGSEAVDARDPQHPRTLSRTFQFDVELPVAAANAAAGGHVWLRFDHGLEPLGLQWFRRLRQLLLSRFDA
jgi:putative peptide zinc metalloprotease protein